MTATNWIRYCREHTVERGGRYVNSLQWLKTGRECVCEKSGKCNPWDCRWFADGFGLYCGEEPARALGIPYYIPDPYTETAAWNRLYNRLPAAQLSLEL